MRALCILFCWLSAVSLWGQNYYKVLDDDLKSLIDQGDECLKSKGVDCLKTYDQALELAATLPDSTLAMTYHEVGVSISRFGQLPDFLAYLTKGIEQTNGNNHPIVTAALYRKKTYALARVGSLDSIIPTIDKAREWAFIGGDYVAITEAYIQKADLLHRMGNSTEALEILAEAKGYAQKSGLKRQVAGIDFTMGNIYLSNYDFQEAKKTLADALESSKDQEELYYRALINWSMAMNHMDSVQPVIDKLPEAISFFEGRNLEWTAKTQLANAYSIVGNYEKSIPIHEECLAAVKEIYDPTIISLNNRLLAKGYIETGRGEEALPYAYEAYLFEKDKKVLDEQVLGAHVIYSVALGKSGQKDKAYEIMKKFPELVDSLNMITKQREVKKLQEIHETEKREAQIALLEEKETNSKLQKGLLGAGLLAVLGILGALWVRFRESVKRTALERQKLDAELHHKNKELTTHTLHLAKKNEILAELKGKVEQLQGGCDTRAIINKINFDLKDEENWSTFVQYFEQVHTDFSKTVQEKYPGVTPNELRLMALLKMNLTSKEIANMLNISAEGVKKARQRLRKKLEIQPNESLEALVVSL
ncbi:hypothetical protein GCM10011344_15730 [Dokdonia pacifica]|uniref:DNA-binding transcriptional regulator, CsgD family n=1 Tax=Dokdonia pacifica TaxID=1627892 RepID=A0A238W1H3_9FLAO|nr:tetratricopeptide repeat protein [Dokdonia pacifica]GGG16053.1 hypothetical protein GCM10011344_15730 [Dokdonia pacifica]SNR39993.1 DNA-binding transcriptional regulator, CsgD family [Dokdonia pacifica]